MNNSIVQEWDKNIYTAAAANNVNNFDPLFVNSANGDYRLLLASAAIDIGNNIALEQPFYIDIFDEDQDADYLEYAPLDLAKNPRYYGSSVDAGAFEHQGGPDPVPFLYVDSNASGNNDGTSWADAFNDLQDALAAATVGTEIWVAAGTYYPSGDDPSVSFVIPSGVSLYGGFSGTETDLSQRDVVSNITILEGDSPNFLNSYLVVYIAGSSNNARLDGFTISGGNGEYGTDNYGGGIKIEGGAEPVLANLTIQLNQNDFGAGLYVNGGIVTIDKSNFVSNAVINFGTGGAIYADNAVLIITNTRFADNTAWESGGIYLSNSSLLTAVNVDFDTNSAFGLNGGALEAVDSDVSITNGRFYNNYGNPGAGILFSSTSADHDLELSQTTFTTSSSSDGVAIRSSGGFYSSATIANSIFWANVGSQINIVDDGSNLSVSNSIIDAWNITDYAGFSGSIMESNVGTGDPLFTNIGTGDLTIMEGSSAQDFGDVLLLPFDDLDIDGDNVTVEILPLDLAGNPRVSGSVPDAGAYELQVAGGPFVVTESNIEVEPSPVLANKPNIVVAGISINITEATTLNSVTFTTNTDLAQSLGNYRLFHSPDWNYVHLEEDLVSGTPSFSMFDVSFFSLSYALSIGDHYFYLVADVADDATPSSPAITFSMDETGLTFSNGTVAAFSYASTELAFTANPNYYVTLVNETGGEITATAGQQDIVLVEVFVEADPYGEFSGVTLNFSADPLAELENFRLVVSDDDAPDTPVDNTYFPSELNGSYAAFNGLTENIYSGAGKYFFFLADAQAAASGTVSPITFSLDNGSFTPVFGAMSGVSISSDPLTVLPPGVNPPLVDTNTGITVNEGATHTIQLTELSGSDADLPPASSLVYNISTSASFGQVLLSGLLTTSFTQQDLINGTVSYQHDGSENFIDGFAFTLTDGSNTTTTVSVNITIVPVNDLPTFTFFTNAITTTLEDTEVQITLAQLLAQGNETDVDGTVMGFKVTAVTSGSLKIGASAGIATPFVATTNDVIDATNNAYWTPEGNVNGPGIGAMELLAVDDGGGVSATAGVIASVNVTAVNDAPVFVEQSFTTVENDAAFEAQLVFSDVDSDPLSFFIASGNTGGTFAVDPSTGLITVAQVVGLDYETTPEFQLNVGVTDAVDSVVAIITIQLTDEPEAPVALAGSNVTTFGFTAYWNQLSGVDGYRLEVATDALFTTRLTGFDPKEQTDTTVIVTGLYHASSYYYRLKAFAGTAETAYSNTIEVKTLHSAELTSDSTALVKIYDEMGGAGWTNSANWKAAQVRGWSSVVVENSRVTALNLPSNNVTGAFPTLTGTELNALIQLDLANNQITTVPANANLAALQVLDLSSNQLDFGSLEQFAGVTTFSYSPQADLFTAVDLLQERGEPLSIDRTSAGASNQYQWYKNGTAIDGATGPVYTIAFPTFAEEGSYTAQVSNTQLPNLTLTTLPITLRVSSLERDRLILTELYNLTGGDSWNNNTNWNTADIASWFGITVANDRVTGITLPSNNLVGELPLRLGDMRRLTAIDISNNEVSSLPALTNIIELTTFNVSNNRLQFDDLEPNVGIASINYAPQKLTGQARDEKIAVNTAVTVEVPVGGTANSYQWYRNGSPIAAGTSSTYQLGPIRYENMGSYELEITSSKVAGLTLRSEVQRVLGTAMITGSIIDLNNASVANANGALLGVKTGAYDTTGFYTSSDNGVLTINDVVLGDYLLYGEQDKQVYIPSYYRSTIDWVFADLIQLRDNIGDLVLTMVNVPRELTPADGDNTFKGLFESDFGDTGGKVLDRSRVQGAGVSVSRSRFRAKDNEDDYELIAYVQTDETGQFEMNNLPDGDYRVNIQYPGIPMDPTSFIDFQLGGGSGVEQNSIRINALATPTKIVVTKVEETGIYLDYFKGLVVYPNPADDYITIRYEKLVKGRVEAELIDMTGQTLRSKMLNTGGNEGITLDVTELRNGMYILRFHDLENKGVNITSFKIWISK
ncbi:MAG: cadherin-like domain-containing protein [Imperialibacter sp.]|uniref:cadherin-like domain-containing protein n=1 Tax=Imperialibacter sp. TaxID=2038411 RepID=UPI003A85829E